MTALIRSEWVKLRSTRLTWVLVVAVLVVSVLASVTLSGQPEIEFDRPLDHQQFLFISAFVTKLIFVVLGIRMVTDEFRHGTAVPTFLLTPRRQRVVLAKACVAAGFGLVVGLVGQVVLFATASLVWSSTNHRLPIGGDVALAGTGGVAAAASWTVLGVVVGALVRSPVAATAGTMVWLMGLEDAVHGRIGHAGDYLPGSAGNGLSLALSRASTLSALATMASYVALGIVAAGVSVRGRDV